MIFSSALLIMASCVYFNLFCIQDDSLSLAELYAQIKHKIVVKESLVTFDRNHQEFEKVLRKACAAKEHLTVGHAKTFFICTSNLDPSLRRIVREQRGAITDVPESEVGDIDQSAILKEIVGDAEFLFDYLNIWNSITKQLQRLTIGMIYPYTPKPIP